MAARLRANRIFGAHIMASQAGFQIAGGLIFMSASFLRIRPKRTNRMVDGSAARLTMTIQAELASFVTGQAFRFLAASFKWMSLREVQRMDARLQVDAFMAILTRALSMAHTAPLMIQLCSGAVSPAEVIRMIARARDHAWYGCLLVKQIIVSVHLGWVVAVGARFCLNHQLRSVTLLAGQILVYDMLGMKIPIRVCRPGLMGIIMNAYH
jgi:uncharacterized integral membrane protein